MIFSFLVGKFRKGDFLLVMIIFVFCECVMFKKAWIVWLWSILLVRDCCRLVFVFVCVFVWSWIVVVLFVVCIFICCCFVFVWMIVVFCLFCVWIICCFVLSCFCCLINFICCVFCFVCNIFFMEWDSLVGRIMFFISILLMISFLGFRILAILLCIWVLIIECLFECIFLARKWELIFVVVEWKIGRIILFLYVWLIFFSKVGVLEGWIWYKMDIIEVMVSFFLDGKLFLIFRLMVCVGRVMILVVKGL